MYLIHRSRYIVLDILCLIYFLWYIVTCNLYILPDIFFLIFCTWYIVPDILDPIYCTWYIFHRMYCISYFVLHMFLFHKLCLIYSDKLDPIQYIWDICLIWLSLIYWSLHDTNCTGSAQCLKAGLIFYKSAPRGQKGAV